MESRNKREGRYAGWDCNVGHMRIKHGWAFIMSLKQYGRRLRNAQHGVY